MKNLNFSKRLSLLASGIVLTLGMASAQAAPEFSINPSALGLGGPVGPIKADSLNGVSSQLLHTVGNTHEAIGYISYSGFAYNGANLGANITGLNFNYGIYLEFSLKDVTTTGVINQANSVNTLTELSFTMYADPGNTNVFNQATLANEYSINGTGDDIPLASGNLVTGTSSFNSLLGAALNGNTTFNLTAQGALFFVDPMPFYDLMFNAFNNTTQAPIFGPNGLVALNSNGISDFNRVPEPGTLALLALALLGVHAVNRRRQA
ncbi:PEP-CTERM protein-sorting domain-containing protein [Duganella sp. CF517]|uniref:flocculation-associated PEP-CTERM protein PepA n=1 Tax=Duganella sp. CF517 TaxID=1881038 RepID=UPI0008B3CF9C|nr:flocculation-associated PEP-CTERM protein PepA [Duganella sp. CF517]SEN84737.1 PEP-CTERM protein-sorting domain-containing protein [Duganella sp. CF517]